MPVDQPVDQAQRAQSAPTLTPGLERPDWLPAEDAALQVARLAFLELTRVKAADLPETPPYIQAALAAAAGAPVVLPELREVPAPVSLPVFETALGPVVTESAARSGENYVSAAAAAASRSELLIASPSLVAPPVISSPAPAISKIRQRWRIARRIGQFAVRAAACWLILVLGLTLLYRFVNPPLSNLMLGSLLLGHSVAQTWVPLEAISPNLIKAVAMSEDARFCEHWGVDWSSVNDALDEERKVGFRGASTIPMQTAKNMFLWNGRSYLRKAAEFPLSYLLTAIWPKRRLMEIYLNIAEWGPGIYGAEAAARFHFKLPAAKLSARQAALLAVSLPNPILRRAGQPTASLRLRAKRIELRMIGAEAYLGCLF